MTVRTLWLFLTLVGTVAGPCVHAGDVYKWNDSDGRVHFGDRPPEGASAQEIPVRSFDGAADSARAVDANSVDRSVTVFSAVWCGLCKQAKSQLKARGVSFTEYDIETNGYGKAEFKRLGGRGVPLILVGAQRMNGFSSDKLDRMLKDAGLLKSAVD